MAAKRSRTSGKKVKSLRAKSLSGKKAKGVKGGSYSFGGKTFSPSDPSLKQMGDGSVYKVQKV